MITNGTKTYFSQKLKAWEDFRFEHKSESLLKLEIFDKFPGSSYLCDKACRPLAPRSQTQFKTIFESNSVTFKLSFS